MFMHKLFAVVSIARTTDAIASGIKQPCAAKIFSFVCKPIATVMYGFSGAEILVFCCFEWFASVMHQSRTSILKPNNCIF